MEDMEDIIGGFLLSEIGDKNEPSTIDELQSEPVLKKYPREILNNVLSKLVQIGIICKVRGECYITAEKADRYTDKAAQSTVQRRSEPLPQRDDTALVHREARTRRSAPTSSNPTHSTGYTVGQQQALAVYKKPEIQSSQTHHQVATTQNYETDTSQAQEILNKFQRIISVFKEEAKPLRGHEIAKMSGIGQSKSDVNRYLYPLKERGILKNENNTWTYTSDMSENDLRTCAALMAGKSTGKRDTKSSSGQLMPAGSQSANGSASTDCSCSNKGPSCHHLHQTNHYHNYNIQLGDNNQLLLDGGGLTGNKKS